MKKRLLCTILFVAGHLVQAQWYFETSVDSRASVNFAANTWTKWSDATFGHHGSTQELVFLDELSNALYRVTLIVGSSYNNNMISIERL